MDDQEKRLSNCHLWAWRQLVKRGGYIAFRKTRYAALECQRPEWWWTPFWAVGVALQHVGSWMTFAGWLLRWRSWYHVYWSPELSGPWQEFYPERNATRKFWVTPIIFKGHVRNCVALERTEKNGSKVN